MFENVDNSSSDTESQENALQALVDVIKQDAVAWKICRMLSSESPRELWKITNALGMDYSEKDSLLDGPLAMLIRHNAVRTSSTRLWYYWQKEAPICKRIRLEIRRENAAQRKEAKEASDAITLAKYKQKAAKEKKAQDEAEATKWAIIALLQQPLEQHELDAIMGEMPHALGESEE